MSWLWISARGSQVDKRVILRISPLSFDCPRPTLGPAAICRVERLIFCVIASAVIFGKNGQISLNRKADGLGGRKRNLWKRPLMRAGKASQYPYQQLDVVLLRKAGLAKTVTNWKMNFDPPSVGTNSYKGIRASVCCYMALI